MSLKNDFEKDFRDDKDRPWLCTAYNFILTYLAEQDKRYKKIEYGEAFTKIMRASSKHISSGEDGENLSQNHSLTTY